LSDGRILLVDHFNRSVKLFDQSGKVEDELVLDDRPWDVTMLNDTTAAITWDNSRNIQLISVGQYLSKHSQIQTRFVARGITASNGHLVVTCKVGEKCLKILTRYGEVVKSISTNISGRGLFGYPEYVIANTDGTVFYVSDWGKEQLIAVSRDGEIVFRYSHWDLTWPYGVATDLQGNVYVCGYRSKNVHQLTSDGRHIRILPVGGVHDPWTISFQPGTDNFLITNTSYGDRNFVSTWTFGE
jgi:hypothetical protein